MIEQFKRINDEQVAQHFILIFGCFEPKCVHCSLYLSFWLFSLHVYTSPRPNVLCSLSLSSSTGNFPFPFTTTSPFRFTTLRHALLSLSTFLALLFSPYHAVLGSLYLTFTLCSFFTVPPRLLFSLAISFRLYSKVYTEGQIK